MRGEVYTAQRPGEYDVGIARPQPGLDRPVSDDYQPRIRPRFLHLGKDLQYQRQVFLRRDAPHR